MIRRARLSVVFALLAGGAVGLIGSTQTWLDLTLSDGAQSVIAVTGGQALPVLAPLSLAALALGLALSIVGPVLRYAFGLLAVLLGAGLAFAAGRVALTLPPDAMSAAVAEATGLSGPAAVESLVADVAMTPWPAVTIAAAVLIVVGGVLALATARRWPTSGRRYRSDAASPDGAPRDAIDSWDELSRGDDPTR